MFGTVSLSLDEKFELLPGISRQRIVHDMPWLKRPLVETPTAVERLRAWLDGGGLDRQRQTRGDIRARVAFYGDDPMIDPVVEAFERMPPPATDYVLDQALIIGTGWSTNGWTGAKPVSPQVEIIVLSGATRDRATVTRTMLHEGAHVWLEKQPIGLATAAGRVDVLKAWADQGFETQQVVQEYEARACALTALWNERQAV